MSTISNVGEVILGALRHRYGFDNVDWYEDDESTIGVSLPDGRFVEVNLHECVTPSSLSASSSAAALNKIEGSGLAFQGTSAAAANATGVTSVPGPRLHRGLNRSSTKARSDEC